MPAEQSPAPGADAACDAPPILAARGLRKHFKLKSGAVIRAVDTIDLAVGTGRTVGVVGESGCGKSTTARLLMQLVQPDAGTIALEGAVVGAPGGPSVRDLRRSVQMVFQDSYSSLNPRLSLTDTLAFGLCIGGMRKARAHEAAEAMLARVGLDPSSFADRFPHELSGGQRQRVNIARALVMSPRVVVLDEAVSALDKSVEAQVLNLLARLKAEFALTYVFISHDLGVVEYIADDVVVMYLGKVVECGLSEQVFRRPRHPYTQALFASRLSMDSSRRVVAPPLAGDPPDPINPPSGCRFRTRCAFALPLCATVEPVLDGVDGAFGHSVACHVRPDPAGAGPGLKGAA